MAFHRQIQQMKQHRHHADNLSPWSKLFEQYLSFLLPEARRYRLSVLYHAHPRRLRTSFLVRLLQLQGIQLVPPVAIPLENAKASLLILNDLLAPFPKEPFCLRRILSESRTLNADSHSPTTVAKHPIKAFQSLPQMRSARFRQSRAHSESSLQLEIHGLILTRCSTRNRSGPLSGFLISTPRTAVLLTVKTSKASILPFCG